MTKIDIASVPEIKTSVGIQGSAKQREVAGPFCAGIIAAAGVYLVGQHLQGK
ncbi:hypothetical protein [Allosphingosinicella vermicomposti]|uniref:hypothetical protein n=1 Tax=Allosphingosinicella vermicomposti TaxID=614671 RepID=UPI00131A5667|nr:hypothetical protein [Allosphingosinicella vermicomposti]